MTAVAARIAADEQQDNCTALPEQEAICHKFLHDTTFLSDFPAVII